MTRSTGEWIAKHDDQAIPPRVKLRIFERDNGACHICKQPIKTGETWDADHVIALANGGRHAEANLAPAHKHCHVGKSVIDVKVKAKIARVKKRALGITQSKGKIQSPGFAKSDKPKRGVSKDALPELPRRQLYREDAR